MAARAVLHRLVDALPEQELPTAARVLEALSRTADAIQRAQATAPPGGATRWARLVERVEADPIHLDGYSEQLKRDIREFRDDFAFRHDRQS